MKLNYQIRVMQASQLTAINNAKNLLEQCGCFRGPPGPEGPQGPTGPAGKTLYYYADSINNDPNIAGVDPCVYGLFIGADGYIWRSSPAIGIDNSFTASLLNNTVRTIAKQSDGKIIVGGDFTQYDTSTYNYIIRFNTNGTVDTSFNIGTGFDGIVRTVVVQSDDKILVGGDFSFFNGSFYKRLVRLNSDGSLDTSFNSTPGFDGNSVYAIAISSDNKIYVGGDFDFYNSSVATNYIARLTTAGFYDSTFAIGTGFDLPVYTISIQSDNSIMVGGEFTVYNGTGVNKIVHILSDGTIDTTDFISGIAFNNSVYFIKLLSNSNLLVLGAFTQYNGTTVNRIVELYANGSIYNTFSSGFNAPTRVLQVDLSNNYLIGGDFTSYNGNSNHYLTRIDSLGNYKSDYPVVYGFNNPVYYIYSETYNKFLVGGSFTSYDSSTTKYITRLSEKTCSWINTYTNILGTTSNTSTFIYALVSTTNGLGTLGYISSPQLTSTVRGLGSSGYISSSQLTSTFTALSNYVNSYISSQNIVSSVIGLSLSSIVSSINLAPYFTSTVNGLGNSGYVSSSQLTSSLLGLTNFGYISTSQLYSTISGLSLLGYVSSTQLQSTVNNLGRAGYISSSQLTSTVRGIPAYIQPNITSTIIGLGTFGYISTSQLLSTTTGLGNIYLSTNIVPSTIDGLGSFGYISSSQLISTVNGIGTNTQPNLTSTIVGLGTFGYISSAQLLSTTTGLGNIYLSTNIVPSTIDGLGSFGYISTSQLISTVNGLGTNTQPN